MVLGMLKPEDMKLLGKEEDGYLAYWVKQNADSVHLGHRAKGVLAERVAAEKPWDFKSAFTETVGNDIEVWVGGEDTTAPKEWSEHTHSLIPGSTLHVVPGVTHLGMAFPLFMAERFASLADGTKPEATAPVPQQMKE